MSRSRHKKANPINDIAKKERLYQRRFTSSEAGAVALAVTQSQGLLLGLMGNAVMRDPAAHTCERKAILALTAQSFRLSRCAYLLISAGYPLQSIPVLRAIYERIATALYLRSRPDLAAKFVNRELKDKDLPKYATVAGRGVSDLMDELVDCRRYSQDDGSGFSHLRATIPHFYGQLSDYTHPGMDTTSWQFGVEQTTGQIWFQYEPHQTVIPHATLCLLFLYVEQFILQGLLLVEFRQEGQAQWEALAEGFDTFVLLHSDLLESKAEQIRERYIAP